MSTAALLGPGSVVGGELVIVRPLDEGGMGAVYVAEQRSTGKLRALKMMHREIVADPSLRRRFEQEARVGSRIRSEHVVDVLAAGVDEPTGLPYLVMELLEGEDLRHRLDAVGALLRDEVRIVFEQLSHAMGAAHEAGVVHRDLKPENVFLARSLRAGSGAFVVKVLDFGIAKIEAEAGTRATKGAVGSPLWMAPEQTAPGPITPAADVWALGLLAYELLTGKSFWRTANVEGGTTAQLLREIVLDPIPRASDRARDQAQDHRLPAGFDAWFERCVEREPERRFADAAAMWRAMAPLFDAPAQRFANHDALAETFAAPGDSASGSADAHHGPSASETPPVLGSATGDATAFVAMPPANAQSAPPARSTASKLPAETPLESVQETAAAIASPKPAGRGPLVAGVLVALVGIAGGIVVARTGGAPGASVSHPPEPAAPATSASTLTPAPPLTPAPAPASASAPALASASAPASAPALASASAPASASALARAPAASLAPAPKRTAPGGFTDPVDRGSAVTWKVQDRHVRLFTRLVSNDSNVADAVVRKAVEWSSWGYLRCYERVFSGAKDLPEGTVSVGFDILDQLPRHATLVSSTIESPTFNDCVVRTLVGQTINAAGPDGKGHVVHAFRFVPN